VRRFNVTGLCVSDKHYMADISQKISKIEKMVDYGQYITINRPRQYGKTTTLNTLANTLRGKYIIIKTSFEGVSDDMFLSEENFCGMIFDVFADSVEFIDPGLSDVLKKCGKDSNNFNDLSRAITDLIRKTNKDVVLIIDEVDKSSNSRVFLKFLGLLRNKYLARNSGEDITFKSVILSGVHDIKNLKLAIRDESSVRFNSPWNISAKFKVDLSFSSEEIKSMLLDYSEETGIKFNTSLIADEIYKFTNGYPYLVSDICLIIDEDLDKNWTLSGVYDAIKQILKEKNTLFEDVIKNIENNEDLKAIVFDILVEGMTINYNPDSYEKGIMYGIFTEKEGDLIIHNKIFEERIYNYLIEQRNIRRMIAAFTSTDQSQSIDKNRLNMEKVLLKFQEFMFQEYRKQDEKFYETNGRLIFLAYLKPLINGRGFSFVEAQTRQNKRMDVVITSGQDKFVVELKIWNGKKYEEKGLKQLVEYLNFQNLDKGYMIVFNLNTDKQYTSGWTQVDDKEIFEVLV